MNDPRGPALETQKTLLRKRVQGRFDDLISGVRAYAEVSPPATALALLAVLTELRTLASTFERHTRRPK